MVSPELLLTLVRHVMAWRDDEGLRSVDAPLRPDVDSLQLVELVTLIEDRLDIRFDEADLVDEEAWLTARSIAALVERVRARS